MADNKKQARLILPDNQEVMLPILKGNMGAPTLNMSDLYSQTGYYSFDPGFASTASCQSEITFIDGEKGQLLHRGYTIEDLVKNCTFLEVAYLLLYGELPNKKNFINFENKIDHHTLLHEQIHNFYRGFRRDAHPMAVMVGVVGALSAFYHDTLDINDPQQREIAAYRLIAKVPTIGAMAYKYSIGQPFVYPKNELGYAENLLYMMFALPSEEYKLNLVFAKALDTILILHADHGQNASTSTVRLAGSSGANPFACAASGIASLWGPAHGGANEAVLKMLHEIGDSKNIPEFIKKSKDKSDPFRLMGFGHRVYKNYDPRGKVMREICYEVLDSLHIKDPLLDIAVELERIALEDPYFVERKLYPNVDFYSGIIFKAIGIPTSMFTVLFAIARTVGWIAHWTEMISDPSHRIGRPRQLYTGHTKRNFVPMSKRK